MVKEFNDEVFTDEYRQRVIPEEEFKSLSGNGSKKGMIRKSSSNAFFEQAEMIKIFKDLEDIGI